jgi:Ceramidase
MSQGVASPLRHWRVAALVILLLASFAGMMALDPIAQDAAYHDFADQRRMLGVPNLLDVASNIAFVIVGGLGVALCAGRRRPQQAASWSVFFISIVLVGLGSAWYHLAPSDGTLVWDRLPMTLGFTALLVAMVDEHVGGGREGLLLPPALAAGVMSVAWWQWNGDLRFYFWVQFAPLLGILFLLALFPARYTHRRYVLYGLGLYGLAKGAELGDRAIFALTAGVVSGHTLKHLLAAGAILALFLMLRRRAPTDG